MKNAISLACLCILLTLTSCRYSLPSLDWEKAQWIGVQHADSVVYDSLEHAILPACYIRKDFAIEGTVREAQLFVSAMGFSDCSINESPVSEDVFGVLPTQYNRTIYYIHYDVTSLLKEGENRLEATLAPGYAVGMLKGMPVFGMPRMQMQLLVSTNRGTQVISSDSTWLVSCEGPIRLSNLYDGEVYDARKELTDSAFRMADVMSAPEAQLLEQPSACMAVMDTLHPLSVRMLENGHILLDMGQNMVGWLHLQADGEKDRPVVMRFAETLLPDSTGIYTENLRDAYCTNTYIPAATGSFSYHPTTVYQGFRYVDIEGLTSLPRLNNCYGLVIYDRMATTGSFRCSNPLLNQLYAAAYNGIRGNYHGMPTDCPQRDERLGWLGDRMTGCLGESFLFDNHDMYLKWLQDIADTQDSLGQVAHIAPTYWSGRWLYGTNVTWCGTYIAVADMLLERYGDDTGVRRHYDSMRRWVKFVIEDSMVDGIMTKDTYGDWCMPPESQELIHSKDSTRITSKAVLSTTMMYHLLGKMKRFASLLGKQDDQQEYTTLAAQMKEAYNNRFFDEETAQYDNNTVTANILSLALGLVPQGQEQRVMQNIVDVTTNTFDSHVSVGVLGIQQLMRTLTRNGHADLAYQIATQTTYPSWGYMLEHGATTIWELWNGDTANPAMNSGNHVMLLGDLLLWYYEDLAGIRPTQDGYRELLMQPCFYDELDFVEATYQSVSGPISSSWYRQGDGAIEWKISLPEGVTAKVNLPNGRSFAISGSKTLFFTPSR